MVYRVFVEKKEGLDNEAKGLLNEARNLLGMSGWKTSDCSTGTTRKTSRKTCSGTP